ncbi:hypothetical protein F5J12DRAFT_898845 [Pisolithus orientalis]|uniref:uncharacterized protein n=1 Tax=Pisolithus orientalis TaxID=936130 RepID=UPI00222477D1|nr:uncharacterized protein F5J12DRAFT_898845 [Pisolithus orientalis]KAI5986042.1 hypothetical protein F5J12DRAFT_898845 [Pisolithus orientalis]
MTMYAKRIEIGSENNVYTVAFAGEGQVVAGYSRYGGIRRWKIEDGQQQGPTMKANDTVYSVAVSPDGRWIVSGESGNEAILWNAATHEKVRTFGEHRDVGTVDISSDGTKLATADYHNVRIFSFPSGKRLLCLEHFSVLDVKFSPDGTRIATISQARGIRVYSSDSGYILFNHGWQSGDTSPSSSCTSLAWSPDGQQLFVAGEGKLICYDLSKSSSSEWSIHENQSKLRIASNGRFIACATYLSVLLWDCLSHKQIGSIITYTERPICVAVSPSGQYLACGNGRNITIHDLRVVPPFSFSLIEVSSEAFESWTHDDPTQTEMLLSKEIASTSSPNHYVLANRALVRTRLKRLAPAIEDAKESLRAQRSPIGHIAMAIALLGHGDREGALRTFDFAFLDCELHDIRFLLLLKSILVFESGNQEDGITRAEYLVTTANSDDDDDATYLYTQVLGIMYLKKGSYGHAIPLMEHAKSLAPKNKRCPPLVTISLIFGWSFNRLDIAAQQCLCETLYAEERTADATEILLNIIRTSDKERNPIADWISAFTKKCAATLERIGDNASRSSKHHEAITQYSAALSLSPQSPAKLLIKRSRARAAKELWEDALQDANEAVKADPSSPWGYEVKHVALHGAKQYDQAIEAFKSMLYSIERSRDPAIFQLRKNYISPSDTIVAINSIIREICCPFVVIDVTTGRLCDEAERMRIFKADPSFKELVSSMTKKVDKTRIRPVVKRFFAYVMFSHAWQGKEPSFQDVKLVKSVWDLPVQDVNEVNSVWDLPDTLLNKKLHDFCKETRELGYNWAWSDTCCIDKLNSSILNESLTSMYRWYANSAATLVFLAGVVHPSRPGDLARSKWMTRAWTLQELLSPNVIFFYDSKWKLYLGDDSENHKESPEIMQELADAIKILPGTIVSFSPDNLGVREKLRLASTRNATKDEDIAYSLIGIFKSDITPCYGEGTNALGHLLEEIVTRTGEVTVLAWSGESSSYNSCLPASISVYSQIPCSPPSLEGNEMESCITKLRYKLAREEARIICNKISHLSPARFAARRLHLPCIIFPVRSLEELRGGIEKLYRARVSGLGQVEFTTADQLSLNGTQKFVFAHPWIDDIRGPNGGVTWGDDSESDTDSDPHEVAPLPTVPATQIDNHTRALEMIARLGQPFNALLLVQQSNGTYKRVAAEREIVVSGLGTNITSKNIRTKVLEIL